MTWNKYFEDTDLANNWFDEQMSRIAWEMFRRQKNWIHMAGEVGRNPKIKSAEDFNREFNCVWAEVMGWLKGFAKNELLRAYAEGDIDFSVGVAWEYNNWNGYEPGDDGYVDAEVK